MWDRKKFVRFVGGTPDYPIFGPSAPFLTIFLKTTETETRFIWKPVLESTKRQRNQLATAKHAGTILPQSQKIRSIHDFALKTYTYARARVSKYIQPLFEKKIFSKFLFYSTSFRKREILKKLSQLVEAAPTVENFSKSRLDLRKKYEKEGMKGAK